MVDGRMKSGERKPGRRYLKSIRRVLLSVAAVFLLQGMGVYAAPETVLVDEAELFLDSEETQMQELAENLTEEYQMNICLLTADESEGKSSAELAEAYYESRGLTDNGSRGGIVLLIDMDNRELNLVTHGDMIYYITDKREEQIYDAGYGYVSENRYGSAMLSMLEETARFLEAGIPGNQYTYDTETGRIIRHRSLSAGEILLAVLAAAGAAAVSCIVLVRGYRTVKPYEYQVSEHAQIHLTGQEDRFVNQFVTKRRIPKTPQPGAGGSGDSGRSSTHSSGGGNTFGGGSGRKF